MWIVHEEFTVSPLAHTHPQDDKFDNCREDMRGLFVITFALASLLVTLIRKK